MSSVSDFRSDTVTKPCDAMREAMARAKVGDDVFGDDPTVNELQQVAARLFGKEAAIFVPSGTMGNLIATKIHTQAGDEIIVEEKAHMFNFEGGGGAWIAGVQVRTLHGPAGCLPLEAIKGAIRPNDSHCPRTALLTVENTHNFYGGRVLPLKHLTAMRELTLEKGLALHIDGARIMNASVASGVSPAEYGAQCDTVMCCLSKGLGAPIGSLLMGSAEHIARAHRYRKALGGGMRQVGIVAAAGLMALREGPKQLAVDHGNAKKLAEGLAAMEGIDLDPAKCETNIVFVKTRGGAEADASLAKALAEEKILAIAVGDLGVRFVTHKHIEDSDVTRTLEVTADLLPKILG